MITEYDISPWIEKYPDPWIRLIEYFPYCKQAQILKNRRYHLVKRRFLDLTKNRPALSLEVSGNFFNGERKYEVRRGGHRVCWHDDEKIAVDTFEDICAVESIS